MKICIICPIGWVFFQGVILGEIDQDSNIHATSGCRIEWNKYFRLRRWGVTAHLFSKHFTNLRVAGTQNDLKAIWLSEIG